jgi:hypothetical protein
MKSANAYTYAALRYRERGDAASKTKFIAAAKALAKELVGQIEGKHGPVRYNAGGPAVSGEAMVTLWPTALRDFDNSGIYVMISADGVGPDPKVMWRTCSEIDTMGTGMQHRNRWVMPEELFSSINAYIQERT